MLSHRNILNALLCTTKTICSLIGVNRPSAFVGASGSSLLISVLDTLSFLINKSLSVWENRLTSLTGPCWQMSACSASPPPVTAAPSALSALRS